VLITVAQEGGKLSDVALFRFQGPKSVVYTDADTNKTVYSLWLGGGVCKDPRLYAYTLYFVEHPRRTTSTVWSNPSCTVFTDSRLRNDDPLAPPQILRTISTGHSRNWTASHTRGPTPRPSGTKAHSTQITLAWSTQRRGWSPVQSGLSMAKLRRRTSSCNFALAVPPNRRRDTPRRHSHCRVVKYRVHSLLTPAHCNPYGVPPSVILSSARYGGVPEEWIAEDPDMFVDKRGNWHVINHAYNPHEWQNCASSALSTHFFSPDGKTWCVA
jgi:hypothetical protein